MYLQSAFHYEVPSNTSLCQTLGLTRSERNKPRARSASIECRRRESPPEAKDERSESFAGGARGFAKQKRVFEHIHIFLCADLECQFKEIITKK